jgi:CheY-like chemotaxis protein
MTRDQVRRPLILVVEDVEETRDGIERLLTTDGYRVSPARNEKEAVAKARLQAPDLILISLGIDAVQIAEMGRRIREESGLGEAVPVVIFCVATLEEGAEAGVGYNTYMTRPDNFDQLRRLLIRLLRKKPRAW